MKIAFFGTAHFSANILEGLIHNNDIEVSFVVSQEDKHVGRKRILEETVVKQLAKEHSIEVLQPKSLKEESEVYSLGKDVDFFVVVAYGKIIPKALLDIPKKGCINLHGSILPKYRGASPVQEALKNGDKETGLTTMYMSAGMDEGDILEIKKIDIDKNDTQVDIFKKFELIGAELIVSTLKKINSNEISGTVQDGFQATYCHKILKSDGHVDFNASAEEIYNMYRAYTPWPGIHTYYNNKKLSIILCSVSPELHEGEKGECIKFGKNIGVICSDEKILSIGKIKLEGKGTMNILDFINGNPDFIGYKFLDV